MDHSDLYHFDLYELLVQVDAFWFSRLVMAFREPASIAPLVRPDAPSRLRIRSKQGVV